MPPLWENMGGTNAVGNPTVVSRAPDSLDVLVYRRDPTRLWRKWWNGSGWQGWEDLGSLPMGDQFRTNFPPAAVARGTDQLDVFVESLSSKVWRKQWKDPRWGRWQSLGDPGQGLSECMCACVTRVGGVALFVRGGDGAVHLKTYKGSGTGWAWLNLGLSAQNHKVTASTRGSSAIALYAQGDDNQLVHKGFSYHHGGGDPTTTPWTPLGGSVTGSLTAVGRGMVHVFGVGTDVLATPHAVLHKWRDGSQWSNWERLEGSGVRGLQAVTWGPNRIDLFGRNGAVVPGNPVFHRSWNGTTWNPPKDDPWESIAGDFDLAQVPGVASWGPNRLDVFMVAKDGNEEVWHRWWNGSEWMPNS